MTKRETSRKNQSPIKTHLKATEFVQVDKRRNCFYGTLTIIIIKK